MSRFWKITVAVLLGTTSAAALAVWLGYRATQHVPEFYQKAIAAPPAQLAEASDECLEQASLLVSEVQRPGAWSAVFTAEQINGWLAVDLVANYPDMLQREIKSPQADIGEHRATLACRYESEDLSTVLSLTFDIYLESPNVVAVHIVNARAGLLPVPLAKVLDTLSQAAAYVGWPLTWRQTDGDPVALVTIPTPRDRHDRQIELESIEFRDGALHLAGRTLAGAGDHGIAACESATPIANQKPRHAKPHRAGRQH